MKFSVGDLCSIWDGEGSIGQSSSWPIGVVLRVRRSRATGGETYQVAWPDEGPDRTWYSSRDIDPRKRPGGWTCAP